MDVSIKLIPAEHFRDLVGMSSTRFHEGIKRGEFYAVKVGRRTFVPEEEAMRFRAALPRLGRTPST